MNKTLQNLIIRALSGAVFVALMVGAIWLSSFYFAIVFLAFRMKITIKVSKKPKKKKQEKKEAQD